VQQEKGGTTKAEGKRENRQGEIRFPMTGEKGRKKRF